MYGAVFQNRTPWVAAGALCLVASILVKPLSLPTLLAVGAVLLLVRDWRWKLKPLIGAAAVGGAAAWALLHVSTDGSFTDVLLLQAFRYSEGNGFEFMTHVPAFREAMLQRGTSTSVGWNLSEHGQAFLTPPLGAMNLTLVLLAVAGGIAMLRAKPAAPAHLTLGLALWVVVPFLFSLFLWGPIWDHYFVQYLPPLSLLAAAAVGFLWQKRRLAVLFRAAALASVAAYAFAGSTLPTSDPRFYENAGQLPRAGRPLLTFDPLLNFLSGTQPGCGLVDPLNVYGEHSLSAMSPEGPLARFNVSTDELLDCLHRSSDVAVVVNPMLSWFLDERLARAIRELDSGRVIYLTRADRKLLERFRAASTTAPTP